MVGASGERLDAGESALASRTSSAGCLVRIAREYDRKGRLHEAQAALEAAISSAEASGDRRVAADALRRLAVVHCRRQANDSARALCARSEALGRELGDVGVIAEALNTAGGLDLMDERFEDARTRFLEAEARGARIRICSGGSSRTSRRSPARRATSPARSTAT